MQIEKLVKVLPKHNAKKGAARPSIALRITEWPHCIPFEKSLLSKEVRTSKKGETNVATTFKSGKQKALIFYLYTMDCEL